MSLLLANQARKAVIVPAVGPTNTGPTAPQTAFITFNTDGSIAFTDNTSKWFGVSPTLSVGDDYEIRAEVTGDPSVNDFDGTLDAWLSMTTANTWSLSTNSALDVGQLLISIRKAGETDAMDSGVITFTVEVVA